MRKLWPAVDIDNKKLVSHLKEAIKDRIDVPVGFKTKDPINQAYWNHFKCIWFNLLIGGGCWYWTPSIFFTSTWPNNIHHRHHISLFIFIWRTFFFASLKCHRSHGWKIQPAYTSPPLNGNNKTKKFASLVLNY